MGQLTTHVLDTSAGRPGAGIAWTLYRLDGEHSKLGSGVTNDDGRNDGPILSGEAFAPGTYELHFGVGDTSARTRSRFLRLPFWIPLSSASASRMRTSTTTCRCSSPRTATAPTGAADFLSQKHGKRTK